MSASAVSYARLGPEHLGEVDLLALAVGRHDIAASLLDQFGSAAGLVAASPAALTKVAGSVRGVRLHAALALAHRAAGGAAPRAIVRSPADAAAWLVPRLAGLDHEELHAMFLDSRGGVVALSRMSQGGLDHTIFDVRLVLGEALRVGAKSILMAHNHPSGEIEPSSDDRLATRRLVEGAALLGINVVDHLIVAGPRWTSMAERGELAAPSSWAGTSQPRPHRLSL